MKRELRSKVKITVQSIVMENNRSSANEFKSLFTDEEWTEMFQFRLKPLYETFDRINRTVSHTQPCYWLWNMMSIAWNGDLQLCCTDYEASFLKMNVREKPLIELWNAPVMKELRAKHKALDFDDIRNWSHIYRCRTVLLSKYTCFHFRPRYRSIFPGRPGVGRTNYARVHNTRKCTARDRISL